MSPDFQDRIFIHQIYYDQASRESLDPGFIALDNMANERPDWYEFWPIRNFLKNNVLKDDCWYGFLSPRFPHKTGLASSHVLDAIKAHDARAEVALFSIAWDQLAYFLNPFEQGELWHPGLLKLSQAFFDEIGVPVDLTRLVTYSVTSVLSNYVVAKPRYWAEWLSIADRFFEFVESSARPRLNRRTSYGSALRQAPMKTFIQERIASVILARGQYRTIAVDGSVHGNISSRLFRDDPQTRRLLQACDQLKGKYCRTQEGAYLEEYYRTRKAIEFTAPKEEFAHDIGGQTDWRPRRGSTPV